VEIFSMEVFSHINRNAGLLNLTGFYYG